MNPMRVLLCGSNYATSYIPAVGLNPAEYQLAGILARGSERSRRLAARSGVPLYLSPGELPAGTELACVAISSSGFETILRLLERRIHVLSEQPQKPQDVESALGMADRCGVAFHLNGHFAHLAAPRAFITSMQELSGPTFMDLLVTDRSLYGALEILRQALGRLTHVEFSLAAKQKPFRLMEGRVDGIATAVRVQIGDEESDVLEDGSDDYLVDIRITVGFPSGILSLMSIAGPVLWNCNYQRAAGLEAPLWSCIDRDAGCTPEDLRGQRIQANRLALDELAARMQSGRAPRHQTPEHILEVSRSWEALAAAWA